MWGEMEWIWNEVLLKIFVCWIRIIRFVLLSKDYLGRKLKFSSLWFFFTRRDWYTEIQGSFENTDEIIIGEQKSDGI